MSESEFLIYRSSAGSGKTQALAKEYLKLVLSRRSNFKNILAITFTNKAAEEMKERILNLLETFSSSEKNEGYLYELLNDISKETNTPIAELKSVSESIQRDILHNYSDFNIGTIDSFMHRIIRSFALELNLSYSFEVQLETNQFISMSIEDLLEKTGEDKILTHDIISFTRSLLEDERSWDISRSIEQFANFITSEQSISPLEKLHQTNIEINNVAKTNNIAIEKIKEEFNSIIRKADNMIKATGIHPEHFQYGRSGLPCFFEKCLEDENYEKIYHRYEKAKRVVGYLESGKKIYAKKTADDLTAQFDELAESLIPVWNELTEKIDKLYCEYNTRVLIKQNLSNLSLSKKIREQMQITMDKENLIPIFEFNKLIWDIIRNQPVPFIYERTSERFDHFLIDEFQDTSSLQWLNLLPLIENSLSQGGMSMVVGDAKQAIYRWRNGDVWQFVKLPEIKNSENDLLLKSRENALKRFANNKSLKYNFRSAKEIISFNNDFFKWLNNKFPKELNEIYKDYEQIPGNNEKEGYVEIEMVPEKKGTLNSEYDSLVAEAVLEKINEVFDQYGNTLLPSNICVLVRDHSKAAIIAEKLIKEEIDVVSRESFLLKSFPEALFFKAITDILFNCNDKVKVTVVATQLLREGKINEQFYIEILKDIDKENLSLWPIANRLFAEAGTSRKVEEYLAMPLYEMCESVIRDFFKDSVSTPAVQYLLDITNSFIQSSGNDFATYIKHLNKKLDTSIPLPETKQAVNIMTIHKAKGLEFPVVIYAFANENPDDKKRMSGLFWTDNDDHELSELPVLLLQINEKLNETPFAEEYKSEKRAVLQDTANLVYVAFTRASERLYIISSPHNKYDTHKNHFYDLFKEYLQSNDLFKAGRENLWFYGTKKADAGKPFFTTDKTPKMKPWQSFSWVGRLGVRSSHLNIYAEDSRREAINKGVLMHSILADIKFKDDVEDTVSEYLQNGLVTQEEAKTISIELNDLLGREEISPFFHPSKKHRSEATLVTPEGIISRPDRVIYMKDHIVVIDFKTGEPHSNHRLQVKNYCKLIEGMGNKNVLGYLLYIDKKTLIPV